MPQNKMTDLHNHLFATLESLRDEDKPMDLDRAKRISEVAQTLINAAKVELEYLELVGGEASPFFEGTAKALPAGGLPRLGEGRRG